MPLHKAAILFWGAFSGFRYSPHLRRGSNMRSIRGAVSDIAYSRAYAIRPYIYSASTIFSMAPKNKKPLRHWKWLMLKTQLCGGATLHLEFMQ